MKARLLVLCSAAVAIGGCHRDSNQAPPANPASRANTAPAAPARRAQPQESTTGMVEAVSQGKSQASVTLKFDLLQRPAVGQPLEIAIALLPQIAAGPATIDVSGSAGVQLAAGDAQIEFPSVEAAQVYRRSIMVTPSVDGVQFVTLSVSLKHDEITDSRVFSVPIIVAADHANSTNLK
jgi:hypothetical protein